MAANSSPTLTRGALSGAVAASAIAMLFYNVMPLYLGSLQDAKGFSSEQIGIVGSVFFVGLNLVSASAFFWITRVEARLTSLLASVLIALLLPASAALTSYGAALAATLVIGGASGGLAAIAATLIGASAQSTRWFGIKVAAETAAGVILLFALPATLIPRFGFMGTALGMAGVVALLIPLVLLLGRGSIAVAGADAPGREQQVAAARRHDGSWPVWRALGATLIMFLGGSAIWAFEERIANVHQFDAEWVGQVLGISLIASAIGSLAGGALGVRLGTSRAYWIGTGLMILGVLGVAEPSANPTYYAIGACLFLTGWGVAVPLLYARVADTDPNGRYIALSIPAIGVGSIIGPAMAGFLVAGGSIPALQWTSIGAVLVSAILMLDTRRNRTPATSLP